MFLELLKFTPPNVRSYTFADVNKAIQTGQAAMAIQWASGAKPMEDPSRSSVAGKLGYALVPKAVRQTPMRGVWTIAIAKNSPNQDAAWSSPSGSSKEFGLAGVKFPSATSAIHSPRVSRPSGRRHEGRPAVRRDAPREPPGHQGAAAATRVRRHPRARPHHGRQADGGRAHPRRRAEGDRRRDEQVLGK